MIKNKDGDNSKQQRWLTFLSNHAKYIVGIDFLVVRTVFFKPIYVFVAISHDRRKMLHFAVTANPHSRWTIQQLREMFSSDDVTKYVIRDNDRIFSDDFKRHIKNFACKTRLYCTTESLAKSDRRTCHRHTAPGMSGSHDHSQRKTFA